ncbi:MAG: xanthine dehydrogenase family protein subunit M [Actinobacteria bacterium]|nr:xanthine dehydrogenase family protein subunit M [Actinomycetota bacterium]
MKPPAFRYHAPRTVGEALDTLAEVGGDGKVLAGGQSLIPVMNMRLASPGHLVDIGGVEGLDEVVVTADGVRVGAMVRHRTLERHEEAHRRNPLLRQALSHVAHPVIRNRGTTVGSIAHADPAGEMPAVLAVLGGHVTVASVRGTRDVDAADFFQGPLQSSAAPDELVTGVSFPHPGARGGTAFEELARRHGDYAIAGVAVVVILDEDGRTASARAAFTGVGDVPIVVDLTDACVGAVPDDGIGSPDAVELARGAIAPESDIHATAAYRRHLAGVLLGRGLAAAGRRAVAGAEGGTRP